VRFWLIFYFRYANEFMLGGTEDFFICRWGDVKTSSHFFMSFELYSENVISNQKKQNKKTVSGQGREF